MIKLKEIKDKYDDYLIDEDKLKELLIKPKSKTVWDLKYGDSYYYLDSSGNVSRTYWDGRTDDEMTIAFGNVFLTEEEAEFEIERRKCETIMLKYGRRTFKPRDSNYIIRFDNDYNQAFVDVWSFSQFQGTISFDTKELGKKAIDEIGEERLKKYIFRVEN